MAEKEVLAATLVGGIAALGAGAVVLTRGPVSLQQLRATMPNLGLDKAVLHLPHLNAASREAGLTTPVRLAAWLAQLGHESGDLRWFEELASGEAYEGRKDLGNTQPGDGRRYKGRGPIQLTGRANYRAAGQALGLDLEGEPEQVATPGVGYRTAAWFWTSRGLNTYADQGDDAGFRELTRRINGGYNGLGDRLTRWRRAREVLGVPA